MPVIAAGTPHQLGDRRDGDCSRCRSMPRGKERDSSSIVRRRPLWRMLGWTRGPTDAVDNQMDRRIGIGTRWPDTQTDRWMDRCYAMNGWVPLFGVSRRMGLPCYAWWWCSVLCALCSVERVHCKEEWLDVGRDVGCSM